MYNMSVQKQENLNNDNDDNKDKDSSENSLTAAQDKIKLEWSPENENILVEWCDFAQCYKWLNSRASCKIFLLACMVYYSCDYTFNY